jgi:outer membrane protein TolC
MKLIFAIFFSFQISLIIGQNADNILNYVEYIEMVKKHHPIAYQAHLKLQAGEAKLQKAKGGFDPKLEGAVAQKYYDGKNYYSYINAGLKIPTWFGLTGQAGYNITNGNYYNPESKTPDDGLWYAGVSLNLGNGLIIDKRRAELKQAKIYVNSSEMEQKLILNQLIFDASMAYWEWCKSYSKYIVYQKAQQNAYDIYQNVKFSAQLGEKPYIDTLKALIQLQNQDLKLEQQKLNLQNKKIFIETFLWQDGFIPLEIDSTYMPLSLNLISEPASINLQIIDSLVLNHPEIQYYMYDIDMAKIDFRLKKEQIKPIINVKYNLLSTPNNQSIVGEYDIENYQWGAQIAYPLFTRKERGNIALSEIKINEKESGLTNKKTQIQYKITSTLNNWVSSNEQFNIYQKTVNNYKKLYESEKILYQIGESSLFLVNFRQKELIEAEIKLIEIAFNNFVMQTLYNYHTVNYY